MQEGVVPEEVTLIGDKSSDLKAAQTVGTGFIGRVLPGNETDFPEETVVVNSFEKYTATHIINERQ
jgi:phosphoglycolate phosphatase-like HAD superfamily hydrolase